MALSDASIRVAKPAKKKTDKMYDRDGRFLCSSLRVKALALAYSQVRETCSDRLVRIFAVLQFRGSCINPLSRKHLIPQ